MAVAFTILGAFHLYHLNGQTAFFGLLSTALYVLFYTPLKTKTPLAVFVGAIPGAIPFMLGWVAVTNDFGIETGTLFMIQFFWQFPHFWALGWMLDEDYKAGGFKMLPTLKKDQSTALQIIYYTFWTILSSIIPYFGFTGRLILSLPAMLCILLLGLFMLYPALQLYRFQETIFARKLMLHSVIYITLIQVIYVVDALV
jgi:protoheme IX farnesyltransferase